MTPVHRASPSRRGFCLCCLSAPALVASGTWLTPRQAFAEARGIVDTIKAEAARASITIHRLRGGVAVLEGSGGNVAVLTGTDGKLMVDAGIGASRRQMTGALAELGTEPVTRLINTHWHFDHSDGNEWLHSVGARILAHENTRKHLSAAQRVEDWSYDFPAAPAGGLPVDVFAQTHEMRANGTTLQLRHYEPAHTDSDISVHFVEPDILHTGDTFWNGVYPFIDYSTGGSIDGTIRAADANLATTTDSTIIIPGHGRPVGNRRELQDFRDMLVDIRMKVAALKRSGLSLEQVIAARPTSDHDAKWGSFVIGPDLFTRLVHEGV